jgi:hypothetical protein
MVLTVFLGINILWKNALVTNHHTIYNFVLTADLAHIASRMAFFFALYSSGVM